jgi:outer membrane lipase/esterase
MPRTKLLASALALALGGATAAQAQSFSGVVAFGDSLSDAGQYPALPAPFGFGAGSFTTNPDDVWVQLLAAQYGYSLTASGPTGTSGTDFAYGGAPTSFNVTGVPFTLTCIPSTLPCRSVSQQISTYLGQHGGLADPNALYTYWAGANDLFNYLGAASIGAITPAQTQTFVGASALTAAGQLSALQAAGARTIVVMNLPDIGVAPSFRGTSNQGSVSGLVFVYNSTLNTAIGSLGDGIVPINAYAFFNEIQANPGAFGLTNTTATACNLALLPGGSSLFCTPGAYVNPTANQTYAFADGVHPSGASHALLAKLVVATLAAPGQVSLTGELPLQVYDDHSSVINGEIFGMSGVQRDPGETNVYAHLQFGRQDFNASANTRAFEGNRVTGTFGADVRLNPSISLGAALSVDSSDGDGIGSAIDGKEILLSGYGVAHFGRGYVDAIVSGGSSQFDIDRSIVFGPTTRVEHGSTSATHIAAQVGGGFKFGGENLSHGPFVSLTWQKVDVNGYAEDGLSSSAMYFNDFSRKSQVTRLGYQVQGQVGSFRPFARIAWARDNEKSVSAVQAGSNTLNGHFTLDGFIPSEDWQEADVGFDWAFNDHTSMSLAYRARLGDDTQDVKTLNLGVRWEFGNAPEAVPVAEAVVAPQQTCADLDDDGDGVNNCDDKCPGSPAGEAVGADGCPVPAPEPVPEAKPYRN